MPFWLSWLRKPPRAPHIVPQPPLAAGYRPQTSEDHMREPLKAPTPPSGGTAAQPPREGHPAMARDGLMPDAWETPPPLTAGVDAVLQYQKSVIIELHRNVSFWRARSEELAVKLQGAR